MRGEFGVYRQMNELREGAVNDLRRKYSLIVNCSEKDSWEF